MSARQDALEERLSSLEDKLQGLQVSTYKMILRFSARKVSTLKGFSFLRLK